MKLWAALIISASTVSTKFSSFQHLVKLLSKKTATMSTPNVQSQPIESSETDEQQPQQQSTECRPTGAGVNTGAGTTRPKTAEELEADRLYEEAMEEEYAKREGGA